MRAFLLFVGWVILEIAVIIEVGRWLGVLATLALLIGISVIGGIVVKAQGLGLLMHARTELASGRIPDGAFANGVLLLLAGLLLTVPGFVTDVVGAVLLVPPVRKLAVRRWQRRPPGRRPPRWPQDPMIEG